MIDPYRMIIVNIIMSSILILAFLFYKYIYPKKNPPYLLILFLLSLLPLISMLRKGTYESGDLSLHAMRSMSFSKILFEERIRPTWTPEFNAGFGDPHFLFSYFLPYFLVSLLHKIGFSFLISVKLILAIFYILSGFFMYKWIKNEFNEKSGFIAATFYLFAPYHLIDMHFRVTIAESMAFAFLPLCMYLIAKIIKTLSFNLVFILGIVYALLITTHQITSLFFFPILIAYTLLLYLSKKNKSLKELLYAGLALIIALGLSCFYWLPILAESKYTQASLYNSIYTFVNFHELLYSQWRFGLLFQGHYGELSFLIGYAQILVVIISPFAIYKAMSINSRSFAIFFLTLTIICIFLMLPYSEFIWKNVPLLKYFQFSYRMLTFITLFISALAGFTFFYIKRKWLYVLIIILAVFSTILNWGNRKSIPEINDQSLKKQYELNPDVGNYLEPSSPIWANPANKKLRQAGRKNITYTGKVNIEELKRNSTQHEYLIKTETNSKFTENTLCFPGWNLYINNVISNIECSDSGIISFSLNPGIYNINLYFEDTFVRYFSKIISKATLVIILLSLLFRINYLRSNRSNIPSRNRKRNISKS